MVERKLYKTKLCMSYRKGRCSRQSCSFAHGNEELRRSFGSYHGAREYRVGDLRDKLDRRLSPKRKYSPGRDATGRHAFRGCSPSRSSERKSDRKRRKKQLVDRQSDFPENLRISDKIKDRVQEKNVKSSNSKSLLEQLKEVQLDIDMLDRQKHQQEICSKEKVQEADILTSRIEELEIQLDKEDQECRRIASKIKKFVKAHNRHSRIQDDLKRSQARLEKLGDQLGSGATGAGGGNQEDPSINIVSDGEITNHHLVNPQNETQTISSPNKNKTPADREKGNESIREGGGRQGKSIHLEKNSQWNVHRPYSNIDREPRSAKHGIINHGPSVDEGKLKRGNDASTAFSADKLSGSRILQVLPSTGMAAHADAVDEEFEAGAQMKNLDTMEMTLGDTEKVVTNGDIRLPPPPPLPNDYSPYRIEDEHVDLDD